MKYVYKVTLSANKETTLKIERGSRFLVKNFISADLLVSLGAEVIDELHCITIPEKSHQECFLSEESGEIYRVDEIHLKSAVAGTAEVQVIRFR